MSITKEVKPLGLKDLLIAERFDKEAGNDVCGMIRDDLEDGESQNYAYGIYEEGRLVGYLSIGGAECFGLKFKNKQVRDSLLLGDVYIDPAYRNRGYGTIMISEVMGLITGTKMVFLFLLDLDLIPFYERLGFTCVDEKTGNPKKRSYLMARAA